MTDPRNLTLDVYAQDGSGTWVLDGSQICGFNDALYGLGLALHAEECTDVAGGERSVHALVGDYDPVFSPLGAVLPFLKTKSGSMCTYPPAQSCPILVTHPDDLSPTSLFGRSIDVNDAGVFVVGAPGNDTNMSSRGGAYVYDAGINAAPDKLWEKVPVGIRNNLTLFGTSVAITDDWLMVGSLVDLGLGGLDVVVFQRSGTDWNYYDTILANGEQRFGEDIVLDGSTAFIRSDHIFPEYHEYELSGGVWSTTGFTLSVDTLDLDDDLLVTAGIGGVAFFVCSQIPVNVYHRNAGGWNHAFSMPGTTGGASVAVDGALVVAGSPAETDCCDPLGSCPGTQNGAVLVNELTYWNAGGSVAPFEVTGSWTAAAPAGSMAMLIGGPGLAPISELHTVYSTCGLTIEGDVNTSAVQRLHLLEDTTLTVQETLSIHDYGTLKIEPSTMGLTSVQATMIEVTEQSRIEGAGIISATTLDLGPDSELVLDDGGAGISAELRLQVQSLDMEGRMKIDDGGTLTIVPTFTNDGAILIDGGAVPGATLFDSQTFTNATNGPYPLGGFHIRNALVDVEDPGIVNASTGQISFDGVCTMTSHVDNSGLFHVKAGGNLDMGFTDLGNSGLVVVGAGAELYCFSYFVPPASGGILIAAGDCWEFDLFGCSCYLPCDPALAPLGPLAPLTSSNGAAPRTFNVETDIDLSAGATFDFAGGTVRLLGDFITAIDDGNRFNMVGATLQFDGIGFFGAQELEVCAPDSGPQTEFNDLTRFPIGELRVGPSPASIKLVDNFANSSGNEVLYAEHVRVEAGCQLDLAGHTLYCVRLDVEAGGTVTDSVGGGNLVHTSGGTFCNANDGALASCPCGNSGTADTGCDNAQSTGGAQLSLANQGPSNATLVTSNLSPMGAPGVVLIRATNTEATPVVFGDGLRCVGLQNFVRLGASQAGGGAANHSIGHGAGAGQFFYQAWHRNTPAGFCDPAAAFNLSNGLILVW